MRPGLLLFLCALFAGCTTTPVQDWSRVAEPTPLHARAFGGYSAGCLDGGVSLAADSEHYQAMRPSRQRYYGHPRMIAFLEQYSLEVQQAGLGALAIGDISQPRGGPMSSGHASHQIGLDADIWFRRFSPQQKSGLQMHDLEQLPALPMINDSYTDLHPEHWNPQHVTALKLAAESPEVERIFVNYMIKKSLCDKHAGQEWLSKIRPWWGHDHHYHVRLRCPDDSPDCRPQSPPASSDGCDDSLSWWFSDEARLELTQRGAAKRREPVLPEQCNAVFHAPSTQDAAVDESADRILN